MKNFNLIDDPKIESGFVIPDHYFDDFSNRLMTKINVSEPKVIPLFKLKKLWFGAAAAVFFIVIGIPILQNKFSTNAEITSEYLVCETNISAEEIAEHLTDEDFLNIEKSLQITDKETASYIENL